MELAIHSSNSEGLKNMTINCLNDSHADLGDSWSVVDEDLGISLS